MSAFSKLKYYARKPVAVIMAASLVTSTVPAVSLVAAAPVYAQQQAETKSNYATKSEAWSDLSQPLTLTFDTHPSKGEDGTATATVSKDAILQYVAAQQFVTDDLAYTPDGTNAISQEINGQLKTINDKLEPELIERMHNPVVSDKSQTVLQDYTLAAVQKDENGYQVNTKVTDVTIDAESVKPSDDAVTVTVNEDGSWTIEIEADEAVSDVSISFEVTGLTYQYNFYYAHTETTVTTDYTEQEQPSNPDEGGAAEGETPATGESGTTEEGGAEDGGEVPGDETVMVPVVHDPVTSTVGGAWFPGEASSDYQNATIDWKDTPQEVTTSGLIAAQDAWTGAQDSIKAFAPTFSGMTYNHEGMESVTSEPMKVRSHLDFAITQKEGDEYYFTPSVKDDGKGSYTVTVEPLHAMDQETTFTVTFTYPDGKEAATITATVEPIAREAIDLSELTTGAAHALDFRMAPDQAKPIKDAANQAVSDATGGKVADLYRQAEVKNTDKYYKADGQALTGADDVTLTQRENTGKEDALNDFAFTGQPSISMKAMERVDWTEPGSAKDLAEKLSISGETLGKTATLKSADMDAENGTWFRTSTTAAWADGSITFTNAETPSVDTTFDGQADFKASGQGTQTGSFFVQDSDSKIVRRIGNVQYLYDNVAPSLTAFEAVPGSRQYKSSDKNIWASEKMSVEFWTNEGAPAADASGINKVDASYTQQGSSEAEQPKSLQNMDPAESTDGGYKYAFDIDADSRVSTKSIKVDLQDKAGNERNDQGINDTVTNIDVANLVAEASAPTINASWDSSDAQNGRYYNHNRSLTLTVNAPFFEYTQEYLGNHAMATITKDGAAWKTVTPGDFTKTGDDTWSCTISFTEDGDYEVSNVNATDVLGRTSTAAGDTFTIDKTTPTMQVSFDNNNVANGKYYNAARTATITITEHNFDPSLVHITPTAGAGNGGEVGQPSISGWSTSGDVHTATVTFPGQGVYTLSVDGMDLATNELTPYTCPEFVVDTLTPEITISGVENMTAYQGDVNPSVAVHDTNLDSATDIHVQVVGTSPYGEEANPFTNDPSITATDASVSYRNPSDVKANDNVYTVVVNAADLAGNTSDDAVTFSVNRFGSTYVISDETGKMLNEYLKFDDTSDVRVTEINPSGLDASQTAVELTRDTSNTTLSADDYTVEQGSASGWQEYVYTVNRDNYDTDGVYRVLFHSQDRAGNVSENEMEGKNAADEGASAQINFAVDDTAPLASFVDLSNTEPYNESSHVAKVTFEDNLMLDHAVVEINGEEVATFDAEQLAQSATQEFTINESTGNQSVRVTVYDAAGNEGEAVMDNVVVTTNAFELWRRNTPLFAGTIAVAVLAAAGVIFVVAKKRSKDGEAEA